ncbi:MAG: hypothetical protein COA96_15730 [SAR86 cluster bacterium]|uniref:Uncharacterized protein n=1 Tax=SAR86 cluster bacterium TaxID=2030880 RepID=A0A2A5APV7_9GAMM|nr:MAG: hypothetical protein COA96_15730 [SAR86 cluster bacterium]
MTWEWIDWPTIICYLLVLITCTGLACADLLGRFKSGNSIRSILNGTPQTLFYILSSGAGSITFFGSETLEYTQIILTTSENISLGVVQSVLFSVATYVALRTTISNGESIEVGPGLIFLALIQSVERRIDQDRMVVAGTEIMKIEKVSPRGIMFVVLPYCFDQAEKDQGDREKITETLEAIYRNEDIDIQEAERSALMLSHLHKIFSLAVVQSATALVSKEISPKMRPGSKNIVGEKPKNGLELALDELIEKLSEQRK